MFVSRYRIIPSKTHVSVVVEETVRDSGGGNFADIRLAVETLQFTNEAFDAFVTEAQRTPRG